MFGPPTGGDFSFSSLGGLIGSFSGGDTSFGAGLLRFSVSGGDFLGSISGVSFSGGLSDFSFVGGGFF